MNMSTPLERSNQKSKSNVAPPSVVPTSAASTNSTDVSADLPQAAAKAFDAPMHAAQGNDDIMSQPQASKLGKKKS